MKLYKKKNISLINGMLVNKKNDKVIGVDSTVVAQANFLETLKQKTEWQKSKPSIEFDDKPFERKHSGAKIKLDTPTPLLDDKVKETLKLADEIDKKNNTELTELIIKDMFDDLVQFIYNDKVIGVTDNFRNFDVPTLGNPCEWTYETIIRVVADAVGCGVIQEPKAIHPYEF